MALGYVLGVAVAIQLLLIVIAVPTILSSVRLGDKKPVAVFGHINPDTDSITGALNYAELLRGLQVNAKAYRLGDLNSETKFVLKTACVAEPDMLPDDMPDGSEVALVDHNEIQQSMKNLARMNITRIVDHHKLGGLTTAEPVYVRFEPLGSTGTILTKMFRENKVQIQQTTAVLLISAILSDTLHFRSATTTDEDRQAVDYLTPISEIDDIASYAEQMFEAKSDLAGFTTQQILLLDYKKFVFNGQSWGIGVGETLYPSKLLERKDDLLREMAIEKTKSNLTGILFSIIDIRQDTNLMLIPGEPENTVVRGAFKVDVNDRMANLGSLTSRKKQIVPALEAYFEKN